jgi:tRNA(fMet)-specific endonuclease VapC
MFNAFQESEMRGAEKKPMEVLQRLQLLDVSDVGVSSITFNELEYGVSKSAKPRQNKLALAEFLAPIEIVPYDDVAAEFYGNIRANLENNENPIGSLDTLIGAHALSLGCILVTNNVAEFKRINGLKIDNWVP